MKPGAAWAIWPIYLLAFLLSGPSAALGGAERADDKTSFTRAALEEAIQAWRRTGKTPSGFPLDLAGFNFLWEASPGDGHRLAAIAKVHGGYLVLFDEAGELRDQHQTGEIYYSVLLCDLDQDAVAEVILDEVEGFGTGYLRRSFHVYKISADEIVPLGARVSYQSRIVYGSTGDQRREILRGSIRCDPGDGMQPRGLAYLLERTDGHDGPQVVCRSRLHAEAGELVEISE